MLDAQDLQAIAQLLDHRISESETRMREELHNTEAQLRGEIQSSETRMREELRNTEAQLREELHNTEAQLRGEIQSSETRMREELRNTEAQLREELRNTEAQLREEIHQVESKIMVILESDIQPKMNLIAEAVVADDEKARRNYARKQDLEAVRDRLDVVETVVKQHTRELRELKLA